MIVLTSLFLILFSLSTFAQGFCFPPYPVYGKIDFFGVKAGHATLTLNSAVIDESDVNIYGEYSFDLANSPNCYQFGLTGRISVCNTEPACNFDFVVSNQGKIRRDFLFVTSPPVETPPSTSVISGGGGGGGGGNAPIWTCKEWGICSNGVQTRVCTESKYNIQSTEKRSCESAQIVIPEVPPVVIPKEPTPELYTCSDGTKVIDRLDCPIESKEHEEIVVDNLKGLKIFGVSAVLIALFIGLYKYLRKKGKFGQAEKTAKTFIDKRTK